MRAVISAVGHDRPGILAFIATYCAERGINITDVTQKVLQDLFTMIMTVEIPQELEAGFSDIVSDIEKKGDEQGVKIHLMHEGIFKAMHTV
ncbi:MAG: ACT domain-containing protein [Oscillospiraceae bacterium]|jgi:ACT domain-containing protein